MPVENQGIRHDPRSMQRDELALMVEQSAVRDMKAALAEAGALVDDYTDALRHRWELASAAVDRAVLAFVERKETRLEDLVEGALRLMEEHPRMFITGAARLARRFPLAFAKALVKEMK